MPSWETNCIEDWETKVNAIVEETIKENMSVISGIPSWVQMYFEKLKEKQTNRLVKSLKLQFVHLWWCQLQPYRAKFENLIGRKVDSIELFPLQKDFCLPRFTKEKGCYFIEFRNFL